jgi:16S rRNA (cytidine1402-2'-O)-methyltransferase
VAGTLYVVATPIGNLEDITLRALRVLREVDLIAAEDTRRTRTLLAHYDISTPTTSYFEHNKLKKGDWLLRTLHDGKSIALVTDAGTPGLSDPGFHLTMLAHSAGIPVVAVPGASALTAALSVSGIPADRFVFEGFLPAKAGRRLAQLRSLKALGRTVVLYESPHRLLKTLSAIDDVYGSREIVICRELTKKFEEVRRGTPAQLAAHFETQGTRGEFTLIITAVREHPSERAAGCPEPAGGVS